MNVALLIPAYNARSTLPRLLTVVGPFFDKHHILVIDDGSTDGTASVVQNTGTNLIQHPQNLGKGAALRTGFDWALARDYDAIITMDADGQHDEREIPKFLAAADRSIGAIIVGSRMGKPEGMPWHRRLSNRMTSWLLSRRTGQTIQDSQCGYRFIRTEVLRKVTLETTRFQMESEILIKASLAGFHIGFIPIQTIYNAPHSSMHLATDTWRFVWLMIKSMAWNNK